MKDGSAQAARDSKAFLEQVVGTFVIVPLFVYLLDVPSHGIEVSTALPPPGKSALQLAAMLLGCDFLFYWVHRSLHANRWLYINVHKKHHEYTSTNIWASEYFSPLDMVLNILPGVVPAVALKSHFGLIAIFTAVGIFFHPYMPIGS